MSEAGRKTTGELRCETVARAGLGEPVKRRGKELFYPCPNQDHHDPSLKINPKKNCWGCFVCGKSGNAWELAAFLARVDPNDKRDATGWLNGHGLGDGRNGRKRGERVTPPDGLQDHKTLKG